MDRNVNRNLEKRTGKNTSGINKSAEEKSNRNSNVSAGKKNDRNSNGSAEWKNKRNRDVGAERRKNGNSNASAGKENGRNSNGSAEWKNKRNRDIGAERKKNGNSNVSADPRMTVNAYRNIIKGICPVAEKCGGCRYIGLPYKEQLQRKQKISEQLLKRYGKVCKIIGMEQPEHYRNKVHAVFDFQKGRGIVSGIYQEGTHEVVPVEECLLEDRKADQIIASVRELAKSFKLKTYDEDTEYGLLRHVLIRVGHATGQIMVVLVLGSPVLPSKKNFVNALCKLHPEITTIVLNVNNKRTSMVLGEKEQVLYGKGYIEDILCGKTFRISSKSFYQVNAVQTEKLYHKAIEYAALTGQETVIDAYCGIGTIGLVAAEHVKKVIGVELNQAAVRDAVANARLNGIRNVDFYQNDAGRFMIQLAEAGENIDVVFMDPPRSGSTEEFMDALSRLHPGRVVYISCNPETLARDLAYLTGKGQYRVAEMTPVDMFPFTDNIEVCVLLEHKE